MDTIQITQMIGTHAYVLYKQMMQMNCNMAGIKVILVMSLEII